MNKHRHNNESYKEKIKMKIPKQISLKTASIMVLIGIIITSGIFYVFAATPSSTFTISSGIYPGAPSYTVWREGSNYFAKDANGLIVYSGTNASVVIQAVLNIGGYIHLKKATYILTQYLLFDKPATIFEGEGFDTILEQSGNIASHLIYIHTDNVVVRNLKIDRQYSVNTQSAWNAIHTHTNCDNFLLDHVYITDCGGVVVWLYNGENHIVQNSYIIENPYGEGISIQSDHVRVLNCHFINNNVEQVSDNLANINIYLAMDVEIAGCTITGKARFGITARTTQDVHIHDNFILGDSDHTHEGEAGYVQEGIEFFGSINGIASHNYIYDWDLIGIGVDFSNNTLVEGNYVSGIGAAGIQLEAGAGETSYYNRVIGNSVVDDGLGIMSHAILEGGAGDRGYNSIMYNYVSGASVAQIQVDGGSVVHHTTVKYNIGFVTENSGTATISSSTSVVVNHGLAGTPTHVNCGFKTTGYGSWIWSATSTQITITVTNSGTYTLSWDAEYKP